MAAYLLPEKAFFRACRGETCASGRAGAAEGSLMMTWISAPDGKDELDTIRLSPADKCRQSGSVSGVAAYSV